MKWNKALHEIRCMSPFATLLLALLLHYCFINASLMLAALLLPTLVVPSDLHCLSAVSFRKGNAFNGHLSSHSHDKD